MSASRSRWLPLALLAVGAVLGRTLDAAGRPPPVAPSAAQLLAPGTRVSEAPLSSGGWVRAEAIRETPEGVELRADSVWIALPGARLAAPPRRRTLWLGSDHQGRDLAARALAGAATSLAVAATAALVAGLVGLVVGAGAALAARPVAAALRLATDGALSMPRLVLILVLAVALGDSTGGVALAIGLASWTGLARIVEAEARALLGRPFAEAARAAGAGGGHLALRHLLPNVTPLLGTAIPLVATEAVLVEATLSFLGAGSGAESWGAMIADGRRLIPAAWWVAIFPGLLLMLTALAFHAARGREA